MRNAARTLVAGALLALPLHLALAPTAGAVPVPGTFKGTSKPNLPNFPNLCTYKLSGSFTGKGNNYTVGIVLRDKFGAAVKVVAPAAGPVSGAWQYTDTFACGCVKAHVTQNDLPGLALESATADSVVANIAELQAFVLNGAQEIPSNLSAATGVGGIAIDIVNNIITYDIDHNVAGANAAHIHGPAARDKNASVLITFPSVVSPMVGTIGYSEGNEAALLAGLTYVNIHSGAFGAGEIRGQVPSAPDVPSVTEWGLLAMSLSLFGIGALFVVRRRRAMA